MSGRRLPRTAGSGRLMSAGAPGPETEAYRSRPTNRGLWSLKAGRSRMEEFFRREDVPRPATGARAGSRRRERLEDLQATLAWRHLHRLTRHHDTEAPPVLEQPGRR